MIDGVIKYDFDFTLSKPLAKELWQDIETLRERLYFLKLIGEKDGIGYGNISKRVSKKSFVITGTQTGGLKNLSAKDFSYVESYNDEKFYLKSYGGTKPSSEALTHGTIYNLSDKIGAVIHIHNKPLWDFMLKNRYKKTENVLYGSLEMIKEVKRIYENIDPLSDPEFVMSGHEEGVIIFSKDLKNAELVLYALIADFMDLTSHDA